MSMIEQKGYPLIMGVDSNAHSSLYGPGNNARGNEFEDFILQRGLQVENRGLTPTFETIRGNRAIKTHIDVTLTRGLTNGTTNWRVCQEYNASDHNTILFETDYHKPEPEMIRPWSKADWQTFRRILEEADYGIPEVMSMKKLDKLIERMYAKLERALEVSCPKIEVTRTADKSHWATEKHDEGKRKVSRLYSRAKKSGRCEDWEEYKKADKEFKRVCKNDKNRAWRKYKECIQSEKDMAKLVKAAQWEERRDINVLTKPDGSSTDPGTETIDLLSATHFPAATDTKHVTYNNRRNLDSQEILTIG